jgi:hypothetical protein
MRTPDRAIPVTVLGSPQSAEFECPLEALPHQIRIFLWRLGGSVSLWVGPAMVTRKTVFMLSYANAEPVTTYAHGRVSNENPISAKHENNEKPDRPKKARDLCSDYCGTLRFNSVSAFL